MRIDVIPLGDVPAKVKREVSSALSSTLDAEVIRQDPLSVPDTAYNQSRDQYDGETLAEVAARAGRTLSNLGITTCDLYDPNDTSRLDALKNNFDCVFGASFVGGNGGICSSHRLDTDQVRKEAIKHVGYMQGLGHCDNSRCVFAHAPTVSELDEQEESACSTCSRVLFDREEPDTESNNGGEDTTLGASKTNDTKLYNPDDGSAGDTVVYDESDESNASTTCPICDHRLDDYDVQKYCPSCGERL